MAIDAAQTGDLPGALGRAIDLDDVAVTAVRSATSVDAVFRAGLALRVPGGRSLRFFIADRGAVPSPPSWCSIDAYDHLPLNDAVRTGQVVVLPTDEAFAAEYPDLHRRQAVPPRSVVAIPLSSGDRRIGALLAYRDRELADASPPAGLCRIADELVPALLAANAPAAPMQPRDATIAVALPADEMAPALARHRLRDVLAGWHLEDETIVDAAQLCASEIVTNVVMHARQASVMTVSRDDGALRIHVHQPPASQAPPVAPVAQVSEDDVAGRGIALVDAVASRWGTESTDDGHTVWFEIDL
jgi:anti-sigma regulatory factor (Ser/Thr protein kinase)